ncbi:MAG TPA: type IV toxin-antitoxin system AbiEi family antitoxin domain-containing protein [Gaiellales bacterium]|nr:type IV toxin-antitoxin system AbiEi family antitoxin domain-containing protein [Gaiellales bacterium]
MGRKSARDSVALWRLAERQHGVVTRRQLLAAGFGSDEIEGRVRAGRLHRLWRGIFAVGRPRLTARGWWSAAVLACGGHAVLSHQSAAQLWGILRTNTVSEGEQDRPSVIDVSVPAAKSHRRNGIRIHRRGNLSNSDRTRRERIAVTSPGRTLLDLAAILPRQLEAAVNEADKLGLIDPEALRADVNEHRRVTGAPALRQVLDRHTFALTDSELERGFLRLVRRAGLQRPKTQQPVCGFRVDFLWPELRLIVETDGLRYHRTAAQQARDRRRDQALVAAGFIVLRFTHAQVRHDAEHVVSTLRAVLNRS